MSLSEDEDHKFTAIFNISIFETMIIVNFMLLYSNTVDERIMTLAKGENIVIQILLSIIIIGLNYFGLAYKNKYKKYFIKFEMESETKRKVANTLIILFVILLVIGLPIQAIIFNK